MLELGHANMVFHASEAAAFEGAREGIVPGRSKGQVEAAAQRILDLSNIRGATIQVVPAELSTLSENIQVTIDVPYGGNTLLPPLFTKGLTIRRSCKLTREST